MVSKYRKVFKKYKMEINIISEEEIDKGVLVGSWLYDPDFRGAVTKIKVKEIGNIK